MKANPPRVLSETGRGHKGVLRENTFIEPSLIRNIRHAHDGLSEQFEARTAHGSHPKRRNGSWAWQSMGERTGWL